MVFGEDRTILDLFKYIRKFAKGMQDVQFQFTQTIHGGGGGFVLLFELFNVQFMSGFGLGHGVVGFFHLHGTVNSGSHAGNTGNGGSNPQNQR